jgi:ADP-ribosylglycohydrolase/catechol 2,3-dioxygenase-like lactoylglutathione lyase family enzyme
MSAADSVSRGRPRAAFLAAAVGDALGWPMEDRANRVGGTAKVKPAARLVPWVRREGGGYAPHEQSIPAGTYSDDTQLLLAVARSRLRGDDWLRHLVEAELPVWLLYERGGGGALKRSANSWARRRPPWSLDHKREALSRYFGAGGNGAAMRCAPHVLIDPRAGFRAISAYLDADGLATHGHPRALVGSRVFAWALRWVLNRRESLGYGELLGRVIDAVAEWASSPEPPADWIEAQEMVAPRWQAEWDSAVDETLGYLAAAAEAIGQGAIATDARALDRIGLFGDERGAGTVSAVAALYLATRYTSQPLQGLLAAAFLRNTDSDTVASMTGALLGGLAGGSWLGELPREMQDVRYVAAIGTALTDRRSECVDSLQWQMSMRTSIYRRLDSAAPEERFELPIFGQSSIRSIEDHEVRGPSFVRSWSIATELGQSIVIKRYDRGKGGSPRWRPLETSAKGPHDDGNRSGLVREVADLEVSQRFYEEVVGLTRERVSQSFVSFGWLALELGGRSGSAEQLALPRPEQLDESRQSIRVYLDVDEMVERRDQLVRAGLSVGEMSRGDGQTWFRCADPDGYVVEFCATRARK